MYYTYVSYVSTLYPDVSAPAPQDTCIQMYLACIWHVSWRSSGFDPNTSRIRVIRSHSFGIPAFQGHSGGRATIHTDTHPIHTRYISIRRCHAPVTDTFTIHTRYTSIHMYATAVSLQGFSKGSKGSHTCTIHHDTHRIHGIRACIHVWATWPRQPTGPARPAGWPPPPRHHWSQAHASGHGSGQAPEPSCCRLSSSSSSSRSAAARTAR